MPLRTTRVGVLTLAREEIRSLPRPTFALGAVVVVLGLLAPIGAFAYGGEGGVEDTLVFTWLVAELVVAVVVAGRVAAARRSRFVDSLYTTPLDQRTWLAAQAIVGVVLAILVLAAQLPFLLVHVALLGVPATLPALLLGALAMGAFAVALGLFCGVIVGDAGPGAAAGLAGGVAFTTFVLLLFHGMAAAAPPSPAQPWLLRITALSPLALVMGGVGVHVFDVAPAAAWRPFLGLAGIVAGLAGAAWCAYTRAQGPLGWDSRGGRGLVAALVALAVLAPVASAEVTFREEGSDESFALSQGEHTQVAIVARGAPIHDKAFTLSEVYGAPDLPLGQDVEADALVLLMVPAGTLVRGVHIEVEGSATVRIVSGGSATVPDGAPSGHALPGAGWEATGQGPARPVYRVPVVLRAVSVEALGESPALVEVHTEFLADGRALASHARIPLDGEVAGAIAMLGLAGLPLPAAALGTLVARKLRTR